MSLPCFHKHCVLNLEFSFTSLGAYKDHLGHVTCDPTLASAWHPDKLNRGPKFLVSPRVGLEGGVTVMEPQSPQGVLPTPPLAPTTMLEPETVGGSKEPREENCLCLLILWVLGCYHNSMESSLNSAEHMEAYT